MSTVRLKTATQHIATVGKDMVVTRMVTYSKISADDVLDRAAENSGINRGQLAASMHAILQTFRNFVCNGHSVELPELGTFRFAINAYAVETDNADSAGAEQVYRRKVIYHPSTKVKSDLEDISLSVVTNESDDEEESEE